MSNKFKSETFLSVLVCVKIKLFMNFEIFFYYYFLSKECLTDNYNYFGVEI